MRTESINYDLQPLNPIYIRPAVDGDVPVLQDLIDRSFKVLARGYYSPRQMASALHYVVGLDRRLILDGTYYAACLGEEVIACGGWSIRRDEIGTHMEWVPASNRRCPGRDPAIIRAVFVAPEYARRGIGAKLVARVEADAAECGFRRAELLATLSGESAYKRYGYQVVKSEDLTLPDGVVVRSTRMSKMLDNQ
ncbi:MAG: GNAT family N-acetyltransferase [Gammaproteobacteria bacterium]|nr:GNAT family N-acetyltransferase [Gammaproteobacteria bacterium]